MAPERKRGRPPAARGKIVTFFSFKGGVGRTMALANCGFAAAMNGARVLVMDWDLEAPGLPYYFRGLIDQHGARDIRRAKGILDLFWGWQEAVDSAETADALIKRLEPYRSHRIFAGCVNPLVDHSRLPRTGKLDVITAGAPLIGGSAKLTYAEALSRFNWSDFFQKRAGGNLIHQLGQWCRQNYDLVLIDSRTGLADVAGICTMQIPDQVYLCFVFNRQNIDGTAQVANSIVAAQGDQIKVRVVPMRVSKDFNSAEESDARARAARDLKRAGLPPTEVDSDLKTLSIPATPGVPYYEALTPFYSNEYSVGDLNWAYLRLTQELLGRELPRLSLDPAWSEEVRKRLQPKISTIEYLRDLEAADPDRAIEELDRFLDGALDADPSLEIDADYVRALVAATSEALDRALEEDEERDRRLESKTLRLIEQMHLLGEGDWRQDFVEALDDFELRMVRSPQDYEERLTWQDRILSEGPQTAEILVQRANTIVTLARLAREMERRDLALERATQAERLCVEADAADAPAEDLRRLRAYVADLRARIELARDPRQAIGHFSDLLREAEGSDDVRVRMLAAEAHLTMAEIEPDLSRDHYLAAVGLEPRRVLRDVDRLQGVVGAVIEADESGQSAVQLAQRLFGDEKLQRFAPNYGRSSASAIAFAKIANRLLRVIMRAAPEKAAPIAAGIANFVVRTLTQWSRRRPTLAGREDAGIAQELIAGYEILIERLQAAGLGGRQLARLQNALEGAKPDAQDEEP